MPRFSGGGPAGRASAVAIDTLQVEIAEERAHSLSRATRRFESALERFRKAAGADDGGADEAGRADARAAALTEAADALWAFVVQREACGLHDTEAVMRDYAIPAALRVRMGARPPGGG